MKKILLGIVCAISLVSLTGCGNKQILDFDRSFNKAMIRLQDGTSITVEVESWMDYEGEQLQIKSKDGTLYLVSSFNCTLINEE